MKIYTSLLKIIGILVLILLGLSLIVLLGFLGFGIDFSNAWSDKGSGGAGTMYMLILPLGFIIVTKWAIYSLSKRRSSLRAKGQETEIRQQVYREQGLGITTEEVIVNTLARHGSKSAVELSQMLNVDQDKILAVIRKLLQSGSIGQDVSSPPSRYYTLPQGEDENLSELS